MRRDDICCFFFFFQTEDSIRDPLWSRGIGDVYKRQIYDMTLDSLDEKFSKI